MSETGRHVASELTHRSVRASRSLELEDYKGSSIIEREDVNRSRGRRVLDAITARLIDVQPETLAADWNRTNVLGDEVAKLILETERSL